MATLEKIRAKSGLLFAIIIIALLAFILGDFLTSGRSFTDHTTIAKVAGHKININDYQERLNAAAQQQQQQGRTVDNDMLAQQTIQQLAMEALINEQYDKLGITVTDDEIGRAMTGEQPHPAVAQFIYSIAQQLGLPEANGAAVLDVANNPARYGFPAEVGQQIKQMWAAQEEQLDEAIKQQAFGSLVSGLFTANNLDAKAMYDDNLATANVSFVSTPFNTIPNDQVEVSDADIKAQWNKNKAMYRLPEETRTVDYVLINIQPSAEDYAAAEVEVDNVTEGLMASNGLAALEGNAKFINETKTMTVANLKKDATLRTLPDSALRAEGVYKFPRRGNTFTIAKVLNVNNRIDSVKIAQMGFATKADADSVAALIDGGADVATVVNENGGTPETWMTLIGAPDKIANLIASATIGKPVVYADSLQGPGAAIFYVAERKAAVPVAEVAQITYTVDPSATTVSNLKTQLNSFLASNATGERFSANADSLYTLQHATVSASSPRLGNANDSRRAVKWAMEAKKGQVSKVFDSQDYYLVVAVKDIYDDDYVPYNSDEIKDQLVAAARNQKKAAKLMEQYAGKANDLEGYAAAMNAQVTNDSTVVFASPRLGTLGFNNSAVQGAIAAAQPGQLVGPIEGNNEIVVFVVNDVKSEGRPFNEVQDRGSFMQSFSMNPQGMLMGNNKIKNKSLKFVAGDR